MGSRLYLLLLVTGWCMTTYWPAVSKPELLTISALHCVTHASWLPSISLIYLSIYRAELCCFSIHLHCFGYYCAIARLLAWHKKNCECMVLAESKSTLGNAHSGILSTQQLYTLCSLEWVDK